MANEPEVIHVEVTTLDIEHGEWSPERNPVAMAIQRKGFNVCVYPPEYFRGSPHGRVVGLPGGPLELDAVVGYFLRGWWRDTIKPEPLSFDLVVRGPAPVGRRVRIYGETPNDASPFYTPGPVVLAEVGWPEGYCFPVTITYENVRAGVGQQDEVDPVVMRDQESGFWHRPKRTPIDDSVWVNVTPDATSPAFSDIHFEVVGELPPPGGISALVEATRRFQQELLGDEEELTLDDGGVRVPREMVMRAVHTAVQAGLSGGNAALALDDLLDEIREEAMGLRF